MICDSHVHGGRYPQSFMDLAEIGLRGEEGNGVAMVDELLGEDAAETSEPTLAHAQVQVRPLDVAGAYMDWCPGMGTALDLHQGFAGVIFALAAVAGDDNHLLIDYAVRGLREV